MLLCGCVIRLLALFVFAKIGLTKEREADIRAPKPNNSTRADVAHKHTPNTARPEYRHCRLQCMYLQYLLTGEMLAQRKLLTRCSPARVTARPCSSSFQLKNQSCPAAPEPHLDIAMEMNNADVKIGITDLTNRVGKYLCEFILPPKGKNLNQPTYQSDSPVKSKSTG